MDYHKLSKLLQLARATRTAIVGQNFEGLNFNHCDLSKLVFKECDFTGATFFQANIQNTTFEACVLDAVELTKATGHTTPPVEPTEALRFNENKTPYGNLPLDLLDGAARVMHKGEAKYGRANYRKGYSDLMSPLHSLLRHVAAVQTAIETDDLATEGGLYDSETTECHVHHVITSAILLVQALRIKGYKV